VAHEVAALDIVVKDSLSSKAHPPSVKLASFFSLLAWLEGEKAMPSSISEPFRYLTLSFETISALFRLVYGYGTHRASSAATYGDVSFFIWSPPGLALLWLEARIC